MRREPATISRRLRRPTLPRNDADCDARQACTLALDPATGQISQLVIQNESESKQFTISADLIARQIGSRIIHLSIPRDQLVNRSEDTEFDSNTGNFGTPMQPTPEK